MKKTALVLAFLCGALASGCTALDDTPFGLRRVITRLF